MSDTPIKDTTQELLKQRTNDPDSTQEKDDSVVDITTFTNNEKTNKNNEKTNKNNKNKSNNETTDVDNKTTNVDNETGNNDNLIDDDFELSMNDEEEDAALIEQS